MFRRRSPSKSPTGRLEDRLPEAGFPRGVGVASATGCVLLILIACFCLLDLATTGPLALFHGDAAPAAAQRQDVESLAKAVAGSATSTAHDLQIVAGSRAFDNPDDGRLLSSLSVVYPSWRGVALINTGSHALLAAHGEPVPVEALDGVDLGRLTVRPATRPGDVPLMLSAVPLTGDRGGQVLVVSTTLRMPVPPAVGAPRQHLQLVSADGTVLDSTGADVSGDAGVRGLLSTAASAASAGSGILTGVASPAPQPMTPVVAYAPVSTDAVVGGLGLAVVTATWLPADTAPARWPGLLPAAALLVLAVGGTVLLRRGLVSPIRRLRTDALAVASGDHVDPVRTSQLAEARRTAKALETCRRRLRGAPGTHAAATRRGVPARLLIGLMTVSLLGWSAAVFCTLGLQRTQVPAALVAEQGLRLDRSADALRSGVTGSLSELRAAAQLSAGRPPDQLPPLIRQLATDPTFRSVYVTDAAGTVQLRAGRAPLREGPLPVEAAPDGLHQHNTSGRVPVVYAYAQLPGGRTLIGEFDITRLTVPLQPAGERVRVVDNGDRTIADTQGYLAFDQLSDSTLRAATASARGGQDPSQVSGNTLVVARDVAQTGAAAPLDWVVVAEQPMSALSIADNTVRGGAQAAALIVAVLALLLCGWQELVVVRPLRRVAAAAEQVATGEAAETAYPQRQDEIGTVASCVEICRQALAGGTDWDSVAELRDPMRELEHATAPLAGNRS